MPKLFYTSDEGRSSYKKNVCQRFGFYIQMAIIMNNKYFDLSKLASLPQFILHKCQNHQTLACSYAFNDSLE